MTRSGLSLALIFSAFPLAAAAQSGPSFDCNAAESSAEHLVCEDPDLAALDRQLAARFAAALAVAEDLDSGAAAASDQLRALQRGWISGRDECWKEPDLRACVSHAYRTREAELVAEFLLEPPATIGEYRCADGSGFTAARFATAAPALRVEQGDSVMVGALLDDEAPTRFYLRSAGMVTFEDAGAVFEDPYGNATHCTLL